MTRDDLVGDPTAAELLALHYDFDVNVEFAGEPWFSIERAAISPVADGLAGTSLRAPDGSELESLFNRFRIEDNPMWGAG